MEIIFDSTIFKHDVFYDLIKGFPSRNLRQEIPVCGVFFVNNENKICAIKTIRSQRF